MKRSLDLTEVVRYSRAAHWVIDGSLLAVCIAGLLLLIHICLQQAEPLNQNMLKTQVAHEVTRLAQTSAHFERLQAQSDQERMLWQQFNTWFQTIEPQQGFCKMGFTSKTTMLQLQCQAFLTGKPKGPNRSISTPQRANRREGERTSGLQMGSLLSKSTVLVQADKLEVKSTCPPPEQTDLKSQQPGNDPMNSNQSPASAAGAAWAHLRQDRPPSGQYLGEQGLLVFDRGLQQWRRSP